MMTTKHNRVIKKMIMGEDNTIYLRFGGSSHLITAKVLEFTQNEKGEFTYLLLDRLVHGRGEYMYDCRMDHQSYEPFKVSGSYVTVLQRGDCA